MKKSQFPKRCHRCIYFAKMLCSEYICDYINQRSEPRGCPIDSKCDRFKSKGREVNK